MDSPKGTNIKEKFRTLLQRPRGDSSSSPAGTPARESTVTEFQDYFDSILNGTSVQDFHRRQTTGNFSSHRSRPLQGALNDFEEEEVLKGLEKSYYDDHFDPIPHELSKFPSNFDQAAVDVQRQRLCRQLNVVTKRIHAQILEKRSECNLEFENVQTLEKQTVLALQSVQNARQGLVLARTKFTKSSLGILAAYRRRQRARILLDKLEIISTLQKTDEKLHQCLEEEDYSGAIQLIVEAQNAAKTYSHFKSIAQLSIKLQDTLELAEEQLDVALSRNCIDFKEHLYAKLQDAYRLLGKIQTSMDQLQMHSASAIHNTAWNVVFGHVALCQTNEEDNGDLSKKLYNDLCCQLPKSSLLACLMDLCRSLCGIMRSYRLIYQWHEKQMQDETQDFVLKKLSNGFQRIWQDVQTKVKTLVISGTPVRGINIDSFIKIIDTIHILIEVGRKFCGSDSDSLQQSIKAQCLTFFQAYHQEHLGELKMHLENEGWELCPVKSTFKVLQLKEFRAVSRRTKPSSFSMQTKSPRKSVKMFTETEDDDDLVAPFDHYLDESILEEDFMIESGNDEALAFYNEEYSDDEPEELTQDFIDEGDNSNPVQALMMKPKTKNQVVPILTNTSLMILRLIGKYFHLMQMLEPIASDVFSSMTQLLDFYVLTIYKHFTRDLMEPYNSVMTARFQTVIARINNNFKFDSVDNGNVQSSKSNGLIDNNTLENVTDAENIHGLAKKIIAVESALFVTKQLVDLKTFIMTPIENESVNMYFTETIDILEDLRQPVYMTSCSKVIHSEVILQSMAKVAWDIREVRSQHSQYVDVLLRELQIFSMRLQTLSDSLFIPKEVQQCLWGICSYASALVFVEGFSCAKKCSNEGRALMQLDFRHFVMKLERIAEIKPLPHQEYVGTYVKAFYIPEAELEDWVKIHTEYTPKQLMCLINSVAYSNNKTKQKLNQMVSDLSVKIRRPMPSPAK